MDTGSVRHPAPRHRRRRGHDHQPDARRGPGARRHRPGLAQALFEEVAFDGFGNNVTGHARQLRDAERERPADVRDPAHRDARRRATRSAPRGSARRARSAPRRRRGTRSSTRVSHLGVAQHRHARQPAAGVGGDQLERGGRAGWRPGLLGRRRWRRLVVCWRRNGMGLYGGRVWPVAPGARGATFCTAVQTSACVRFRARVGVHRPPDRQPLPPYPAHAVTAMARQPLHRRLPTPGQGPAAADELRQLVRRGPALAALHVVHDRDDAVVERRRDPELVALAGDAAVDDVDLGVAPLLEVLEHRRAGVAGDHHHARERGVVLVDELLRLDVEHGSPAAGPGARPTATPSAQIS